MLLGQHPEFQKLQLTTETKDEDIDNKSSYTLVVPKSKPKPKIQKIVCLKCRTLSPCDCGADVAEI